MDLRVLSLMIVLLCATTSFADTCRPKYLRQSSAQEVEEAKNVRAGRLHQATLAYRQELMKALSQAESESLVTRLNNQLTELAQLTDKYKPDARNIKDIREVSASSFVQTFAQDYVKLVRITSQTEVRPSSETRLELNALKFMACDLNTPAMSAANETVISSAQ